MSSALLDQVLRRYCLLMCMSTAGMVGSAARLSRGSCLEMPCFLAALLFGLLIRACKPIVWISKKGIKICYELYFSGYFGVFVFSKLLKYPSG